MFPKTAAIFFSVSLALHGFFAASIDYPRFLGESDGPHFVQIEYIQSRPSSPAVISQEKPPARAVVQAPLEPAKPKIVELPASAVSPKELPRRSSASKPLMKEARRPVAIRRSEDLLADPKKGKLFAAYFAKIKEKIQNTVQRKYSYESLGGGSVTLLFVLDSGGSLEAVSTLEKQSTGNNEIREFAMRCVRDSAPFGTFPKELHLSRISFNLTVLFEET